MSDSSQPAPLTLILIWCGSGATLELLLSPTDTAGGDIFNGPHTIIDNQSAGAIIGSFDLVTTNLLFLDAVLDYAGGDGNNDVTLDQRDKRFEIGPQACDALFPF